MQKEIIDKCIEVGLLHEQDGGIFVYHQASISEPEKYPEGWYLDDKEDTIRGLMHDENGQQILLRELEKKRAFPCEIASIIGTKCSHIVAIVKKNKIPVLFETGILLSEGSFC